MPICLSKLLKQNHRPAKLSYSFSSDVVQKFGRIEIVSPLKPKVPACLWLELCTMVLLRRVAAHRNHGRNDGGQGAQFPGHGVTMRAPNDSRAPKSPKNVISTVLLCIIIVSERPIFQNEI